MLSSEVRKAVNNLVKISTKRLVFLVVAVLAVNLVSKL